MNYVEVNDNGDAPMQTSGPIMKDDTSAPRKEQAPELPKAITIMATDGSISYGIQGVWASHEIIGALEMIKASILMKANPPPLGIMDKILINAGVE